MNGLHASGLKLAVLQVVHHPTIMAAYCEGRKWRCMGDGELRSKFLGPSIQLRPVGIMHLTFSDGDEYTWHKVRPRQCKAMCWLWLYMREHLKNPISVTATSEVTCLSGMCVLYDEGASLQVTTSINNLIVGKLNIDHGGVMHVRNLGNSLLAKMKFKQQGLLAFRGEAHQVLSGS